MHCKYLTNTGFLYIELRIKEKNIGLSHRLHDRTPPITRYLATDYTWISAKKNATDYTWITLALNRLINSLRVDVLHHQFTHRRLTRTQQKPSAHTAVTLDFLDTGIVIDRLHIEQVV